VEPNRRVLDRHVNYGALNRYNSVHHDVDYNNVRRNRTDAGRRPATVSPGNQHPDNKIIRRSIDPNDPRIESHRGRTQESQPQVRQPDIPRTETRRPDIQQPQVRQPDIPRTDTRRPDIQQPQVRQPDIPQRQGRIPDTSQPIPHTTLPAQVPRTNPAPQPRQPDVQRQPQSVFRGGGGGGGSFDPHAASQRGQESRQQQNHPVQQAPRQQAPAQQHGQPRGRGR